MTQLIHYSTHTYSTQPPNSLNRINSFLSTLNHPLDGKVILLPNMTSPIQSILTLRKGYACTFVSNPGPEENTCIVCQELHNTKEGCRAVRLTCGHVVGLECFEKCIIQWPNKCTTFKGWSHHIPIKWEHRGWMEKTLAWLFSTPFVREMDDIVTGSPPLLYESCSKTPYPHAGGMSLSSTLKFWAPFTLSAIVNMLLILLVAVGILAILVLPIVALVSPRHADRFWVDEGGSAIVYTLHLGTLAAVCISLMHSALVF
jgi:hypothetical protein